VFGVRVTLQMRRRCAADSVAMVEEQGAQAATDALLG
jgi:hypothetical protein